MKSDKKQQAIQLRKEQGLSLKEISKQLGVSKSSVSYWVRDIELTPEQHKKLMSRNPLYNKQLTAQKKNRESALLLRREYQLEGREKTKSGENKELFLEGCMLFWAEGSKCKNSVILTNSDIEMVILFSNFLKKCFNVPNEKFKLEINCYLNNGKTKEEIENYWLNLLCLDRSNLNKTRINQFPSSSHGYKKNKLIYGICKMQVHDTKIVQTIYGAIKEFANIDDDRWLF
jgi:transposase-like protein